MKYDCLLPCQNLMAENVEIFNGNGGLVSHYTCKAGDVCVDMLGNPDNILCDVIEKKCRKCCPAFISGKKD